MKQKWVAAWGGLSDRLNALSLRERVLLFIFVIAICTLLVHELWVSPAQEAHKQLQQRFDKQSVELQRTRDEFKAVDTSLDPQKILRDEIYSVKTSLDLVNGIIVDAKTEGPLQLAQVLVHLLRQHEGLTILRTATITAEKITGKVAQTALVLPTGLTEQGLQLTVSGPYSQLMGYLRTLESALPRVRWGSMELISDGSSTKLTLELFVVGEYSE